MAAKTSTETTTATAPRVRKSPQEKAQAQLASAQKTYDKAVARREKYAADIKDLDLAVEEAGRQLDFAKGSRYLPQDDAPENGNLVEGDQELFSANA